MEKKYVEKAYCLDYIFNRMWEIKKISNLVFCVKEYSLIHKWYLFMCAYLLQSIHMYILQSNFRRSQPVELVRKSQQTSIHIHTYSKHPRFAG